MTTLITFNRDDSPVTENFLSYYNRFVDRIEIWDISSDSNAVKFVGRDKVKVVALAEGYKNDNGFWEQIPLLTAELNRLNYQDGTDPEIFGRFNIIDDTQAGTLDIESIIGAKDYVSPNGVVFTNVL
jgi:hypothetical protein